MRFLTYVFSLLTTISKDVGLSTPQRTTSSVHPTRCITEGGSELNSLTFAA